MGCSFLPYAEKGPLVAYAPGYAVARLLGHCVGMLRRRAPMISLWVLEAKPFSLAFFVLASSGYAPGMRQRKKTNCEKAKIKTRERTTDMEDKSEEKER